jgi:hypothetical protein
MAAVEPTGQLAVDLWGHQVADIPGQRLQRADDQRRR